MFSYTSYASLSFWKQGNPARKTNPGWHNQIDSDRVRCIDNRSRWKYRVGIFYLFESE